MGLFNRLAIGLAAGTAIGLGGIMLKAGIDNSNKRHARRDVTILLSGGVLCVTAGLTAVTTAIVNE
jgi:hypothetical protein